MCKYELFAQIAKSFFGESLAESISDALHLYVACPAHHAYDDEDLDLLPILAGFDRAGLNAILPSKDILKGGSFFYKPADINAFMLQDILDDPMIPDSNKTFII